MNANLVLLRKKGAHKAFPLSDSSTVIGRRHDCDLRIPLPVVSRRHCEFSHNGDSLRLRDLGSRGGTFVNDKRLDKEKEIAVKPGDYVRIGPVTFVCQIDGKPDKIVPPGKTTPQKAKAQPKPQKATADVAGDGLDKQLDDELSDLDVSDSFINLDELDADLEDLKDA